MKQVTIDLHNKLRNEIAGGKLKGYPAATKMLEVVMIFIKFYCDESLNIKTFARRIEKVPYQRVSLGDNI